MPAMPARRPRARLFAVMAAARGRGGAGRGRPSPVPDDPATAGIAVTVAGDWQRRGVGTLPGSALTERRPAAVKRLRTVVEAACERSVSAGLVPPAVGADVLPLTPHTQWATRAVDSCSIVLASMRSTPIHLTRAITSPDRR